MLFTKREPLLSQDNLAEYHGYVIHEISMLPNVIYQHKLSLTKLLSELYPHARHLDLRKENNRNTTKQEQQGPNECNLLRGTDVNTLCHKMQ